MKITPIEIRQYSFEKIFRGYNIDEVDTFLANVSMEWERVLNESKMLKMQLDIAIKDANKLREIEMTLFKTLKTAEDTSLKITDEASLQADKSMQEAYSKSEELIKNAEIKAVAIIQNAENKAQYIKNEILGDIKTMERDFRAMDSYKDNLVVQLKTLSNATLEHLKHFESKFEAINIPSKFTEAIAVVEQDLPLQIIKPEPLYESPLINDSEAVVHETTIEENPIEPTNLANEPLENIFEEPTKVEASIDPIATSSNETTETSIAATEAPIEVSSLVESSHENLKIIEGIGPRIEGVLNNAGIYSFKDLATTPAYKISEILLAAGSHYASHDPTTWAEQAKLAAENNWFGLKELQDRLLGGRPEAVEKHHVVEEPTAEIEPTIEPKKASIINQNEPVSEEMLEKVNKVKAAIRKSMLEKADNAAKDHTALPTVNDVINKNESGSFFDNL